MSRTRLTRRLKERGCEVAPDKRNMDGIELVGPVIVGARHFPHT